MPPNIEKGMISKANFSPESATTSTYCATFSTSRRWISFHPRGPSLPAEPRSGPNLRGRDGEDLAGGKDLYDVEDLFQFVEAAPGVQLFRARELLEHEVRDELGRDEAEVARRAMYVPALARPLGKRRPDKDLGLVGGKADIPDERKRLAEVPDRKPPPVEGNDERRADADHL